MVLARTILVLLVNGKEGKAARWPWLRRILLKDCNRKGGIGEQYNFDRSDYKI